MNNDIELTSEERADILRKRHEKTQGGGGIELHSLKPGASKEEIARYTAEILKHWPKSS